MIDIYRLYQQFISECNTHQAGFFRPVRDFVPAAHAASLEIFNQLTQKLEKTESVENLLLPFQRTLNVAVVSGPTHDYAPFPPDYSAWSSCKVITERAKVCGRPGCDLLQGGECRPAEGLDPAFFAQTTTYEEHAVAKVPDSKWAAAARHATKRPTLQDPLATQSGAGLKLLPRGIGVVALTYYRNPVEPRLDYTERPDGPDVFVVYRPETSRGLEWDEKLLPVLLYKISRRYGLFVRDTLILQVKQVDPDLV